MPNRPKNIDSTFYYLDILRRIPNGKGQFVTAKSLHLQLKDLGYEKDIRTMQRTLTQLSEHFHIDKDQQTLEETPDYYRIQATVAETDMIEWWINKFGDRIWDIEKEVL